MTSRERFEAFIVKVKNANVRRQTEDQNLYAYEYVQDMWDAWQEAERPIG